MALKNIDLGFAIGLKPEVAVEYFRRKGLVATWDWHAMRHEAHAVAFTVAKTTQAEIENGVLAAIKEATAKGLTEGITAREHRRILEPILKAKGWWGRVPDPLDPSRTAQLGSPHRLRTIFNTNMDVAYARAHWHHVQENKHARPYLMYVAVLDQRTRPSHAAMHGKVFHVDDPIWDHLYPPNDWGCRCSVRALTAEQVAELGLDVSQGTDFLSLTEEPITNRETGEVEAMPVAVFRAGPLTMRTGKGWAYNPGKVPSADVSGMLTSKTWPPAVRDMWLDTLAREAKDVEQRKAAMEHFLADRSPGIRRQRTLAVGYFDARLVRFLEQAELGADKKPMKLSSPAISIVDLHALRSKKEARGISVGREFFLRAPEVFASPDTDVYWDDEDPSLIFVVAAGEKDGMPMVAKYVVKLDRTYHRNRLRVNLNVFRTATLVRAWEMQHKRYIKLDLNEWGGGPDR